MDIVGAAKVFGLLGGLLSITLISRAIRPLHPVSSLCLLLIAFNASFIVWNSSGLENSLHGLLLTAAIWSFCRPPAERWSTPLLSLCLGALAISRPEGPLFSVLAATGILWRHRPRWSVGLREALRVIAPGLLLGSALLVFRWFYFDDVLPNTFYAKGGNASPTHALNPFSTGWRYLGGGLFFGGWLAVTAVLVLGRGIARPLPLHVVAALGVIGTQVFFILTVDGDWMGEYRFLNPIVPALGLLAG
jgi:hypothetical protein